MEDTSWYYALGGSREGPVGSGAVRQFIAAGKIVPQTLVWREGMADWQMASAVPELAGAFPAGPGSVAGGFMRVGSIGTSGDIPLAPTPVQSYEQPNPGNAGYSPYQGVPGQAGFPLSYLSPTDGHVQYAGFWLRVVAYIIDSLLIGVANAAIAVVLMLTLGNLGNPTAMRQVVTGLSQLTGICVGAFYFVAFETSQYQATPGKMALGLKVTDLAGQRLTIPNAIGRYFAKFLSVITLCIGFMMAGWTQRKQALHDIVASTLVVKK